MSNEYLDSKLNAVLCLALGWPANFLLIWLILYRTSQSLRVWSRVLLQSAFIDSILLGVAFIVQPIIISDGSVVFYFSNGPLAAFLNRHLKVASYFIFAFWLEFAKHAVAVQCFYRWLVICRERQLSNMHYGLLLCIPAIVSSAEISIVLWEWSIEVESQKAPMTICSMCPEGQDVFFVMRQDTTFSLVVDMFWSGGNMATLLVIVLTNLLIWLKTRRSLVPQQPPHRQEVNRQVGIVLLIQALLPLLLSILPTLVIVLYNFTGSKIAGWLSILFTQTWTSFAYPLITLLIIRQYRLAVRDLMFCRWKGVGPTQNSDPLQQQQFGQVQQNEAKNGTRAKLAATIERGRM